MAGLPFPAAGVGEGAACTGAAAPSLAILTSPPFACGVAWLVNMLLELGIRTTHWGTAKGTGGGSPWRECGDGWTLDEPALSLLKWHLPILHQDEPLRFRDGLEVVWEHRLDLARRPGEAVILYLRDPRDAIHSLYRRNYAHALGYHAYLDRLDVWPDHFPNLFFLPPPETYLLFTLFWLTVGETVPLLTVTFEGMRADPVGTVRRVLAHLGQARPDDGIVRALERSSFHAARQAMLRTSAEQGTERLTAAKGEVGEWRTTHDDAALARFARPLARFEALLADLPAAEATWQAEAIPRDPFGWLEAGAPANLAAVLDAVAGRPATQLSAHAAVAAGWFTAQAAGGPDFTPPLPRRLFLRFYAFLLEGLDSAPIDTLLRSRHIDRIHGLCREMVGAMPE
ncbi:sulfotransferase domain-containing protein [Azospirillum thiophilum]|uniref:Sulfotransferase domain-containing protein n=1 Tax=Azospirillum thiophilum TaxID=528244 RepID=A0AAC8W5L8_9PROT|nr:sulfotransferase domain-containing protein [Azospirillum thiophilum]ALG75543.1 hypothetical protein AL072_31810 [Azospirillum thiophilum]